MIDPAYAIVAYADYANFIKMDNNVVDLGLGCLWMMIFGGVIAIDFEGGRIL